MANEYEAIDNLEKQQNNYLDKSMETQRDIINKQTQMNVDTLQRQRDEVDKEATKTNRALYQEYRKASNPYGANAEIMAQRGLGNSGYSETTQTNLYNTYQKNVTETVNNAQKLKSDFDFQMSQAKQNGDIAMAQNALEIYNQKLQLLTQNYELRNNREQFLYQKDIDKRNYDYQVSRDKVADSQWNKQFDYNKYINDRNYNYQKSVDDRNYNYQVGRDKVTDNQWLQQFNETKNQNRISNDQWNQTFNYQKGRDAVADSQWEREYELSKKASARSSSSRSRSSSGSSRSYGSSNVATVSTADNMPVTSNSSEASNQKANLPTPIMQGATMIAQAILAQTSPNSEERRSNLQKLVQGGAISQNEANQLLSAQ